MSEMYHDLACGVLPWMNVVGGMLQVLLFMSKVTRM